jgi:hypothetical protein
MKRQVTKTVEDFLSSHPLKFYSRAEIRRATKLPPDVEVTARIRAMRSKGHRVRCVRFSDGVYRYTLAA